MWSSDDEGSSPLPHEEGVRLLLVVVLLAACAAPITQRPISAPEANPRIRVASDPVRASRAVSEPLRASLRATLACIRSYEGGYRSVSPSGKYRGAYQMDRDFWLTYGGDPDYVKPDRWEEAPRWMQDQVAARGYRARGLQPWPVPNRKCR